MTYEGSIDIIPADKKQFYNVESEGPKHSDMHGNQLVCVLDGEPCPHVCSHRNCFVCRATLKTSAYTTTTG